MKQPEFSYKLEEDGLLELKANEKLLAEWMCEDSDYVEDSFSGFKEIYNDGIDFALRQVREKIMTKETDEQTPEYLDGYADFQREMLNVLTDYYEEFQGKPF